ncbi:DUF2892 domain-containing protein [Colwellia sp. TT2012]|uniref:DUF2892 domain-containing protein n=1 Tax=Colwellia sp. TT2012 TaxID=1720342 RepID=UPI000709D23C|nr:DUF2892 domain-containing protein [Colwellia sp. TT2012]
MSDSPEKAGKEVQIELIDQPSIPSSPYSKIRREISEDDLQSPAVQRLLLGEVDRLQTQISDLELIKIKYHVADKQTAILNEKIKALTSHEVLYGICLTIGSAIIGLASLLWASGYGIVAIAIGSVLVVGGVISKVLK